MVKKLTEQEIIEAFEICYLGSQNCEACPFTVHKLECRGGRMDVEVYNLLKRQKAEIERLTEEKKSDSMLLYASGLACEQVKAENAELQKQVDELKDLKFTQEHCDLYMENKWLKECIEIAKQQAVKDTAKEIFTELLKAENVRKEVVKDELSGGHYIVSVVNVDKIRELAKEKGVEVE